jgi:hypothetical protein
MPTMGFRRRTTCPAGPPALSGGWAGFNLPDATNGGQSLSSFCYSRCRRTTPRGADASHKWCVLETKMPRPLATRGRGTVVSRQGPDGDHFAGMGRAIIAKTSSVSSVATTRK